LTFFAASPTVNRYTAGGAVAAANPCEEHGAIAQRALSSDAFDRKERPAMRFGTRRVPSTATIFVVGLLVGVGVTGLGNAMSQHVKVAELYRADLVTATGKEASMSLAELGLGANTGKHYQQGDAFAYILEVRNREGQSMTLKSGQR
jgi:hypothetical protein